MILHSSRPAQQLCLQVDRKDDDNVDVVLRTDGSGEGRGGGEKKDVLPPLTPGSRPRAQQ